MNDERVMTLLRDAVHDLRAPLGALKVLVEMMGRVGPLTEQQTHFQGRALQAVMRLDGKIEDILVLAQWEAGMVPMQPVPTALRDLAAAAVERAADLAEQQGVALHLETADAAPVAADALHFGRALDNVLVNAVKYNRAGGVVWVRVGPAEGGAQVTVQDTGIGIPADALARLGEPFFRASNRGQVVGSGLGLALVRRVLAEHGGRLDVQSAAGEGSTFTLWLPAATR